MLQRRRWTILGCLAAFTAAPLFPQDPLETLPHAYRRELENEWVRVVRVTYAPHEKLPAHYHTERAAAYVYLNDAGPILFGHVDLPYADVVRPATKAGSYRLYRGIKEVHTVENPNDAPSHFLRVELKTETVDLERLRGRYFREDYPPGESLERVQFENGQVRIRRLVVAPGQELVVKAGPSEPALLLTLVPARLGIGSGDAEVRPVELESGKALWLDAGGSTNLGNSGGTPAELLRFDFRTPPVDDPEDRTTSHPHEGNPIGR